MIHKAFFGVVAGIVAGLALSSLASAQQRQSEDRVGDWFFGSVVRTFGLGWSSDKGSEDRQFFTNRQQRIDLLFLGNESRNVAGVWSDIRKPNANVYAPTWVHLFENWNLWPTRWSRSYRLVRASYTVWAGPVPVVITGEAALNLSIGLDVGVNNWRPLHVATSARAGIAVSVTAGVGYANSWIGAVAGVRGTVRPLDARIALEVDYDWHEKSLRTRVPFSLTASGSVDLVVEMWTPWGSLPTQSLNVWNSPVHKWVDKVLLDIRR